jgi:hypothetical protein
MSDTYIPICYLREFTYKSDVFGFTDDLIKQLIETSEKCPICFHTHAFHWEVGCPALAKSGRIIFEDPVKAKKIVDEYYKVNPSGKPRADKDKEAKSGSNGDAQGGKEKKQKSAWRATSGERKVADGSDASNNRFDALREDDSKNQYVDNAEIESDYSDGEGIHLPKTLTLKINPLLTLLLLKLAKPKLTMFPKPFPPWPPLLSPNTSLLFLHRNVVLILAQQITCSQTTRPLLLTRKLLIVLLNWEMVLNLNEGGGWFSQDLAQQQSDYFKECAPCACSSRSPVLSLAPQRTPRLWILLQLRHGVPSNLSNVCSASRHLCRQYLKLRIHWPLQH